MKREKCVAYMRYSSSNQSETSIDYQRDKIKSYCEQKSLTLVKEFVDEAYSATNDKRPDFQKMVEEIERSPEWDTIVVYDLSRIFRNLKDSVNYKALFKDHGIRLVSVSEPFTEDDNDDLLTGMKSLINDQYSRDNARRTHAGMVNKANKAGHCGGTPPLGYDVLDGTTYTVNEVEAETVREIFRLYELGYSYQKMANMLNEKGLRTKADRPFTKNSFSNILTQEKYIGTYKWNARKAKNSQGKYNNHAYKPIEDQIIIQNGCPAIITPEQFERVQKRISERREGAADSKSRNHYMLSGTRLVKCAECDSYMTGKVMTSHKKKFLQYCCPKHKKGECPTKDIPALNLETFKLYP